MNEIRKFKRVNLLGLDFYVDWLDVSGQCTRIICVKEVFSGRIFVFRDLKVGDRTFEEMIYEACGITKYEEPKKEEEKEPEVMAEEPAAQETEQPKEKISGKKGKRTPKSV